MMYDGVGSPGGAETIRSVLMSPPFHCRLPVITSPGPDIDTSPSVEPVTVSMASWMSGTSVIVGRGPYESWTESPFCGTPSGCQFFLLPHMELSVPCHVYVVTAWAGGTGSRTAAASVATTVP